MRSRCEVRDPGVATFAPRDDVVDVEDLGEIFVALRADVILAVSDLGELMRGEKTPRIAARPPRYNCGIAVISHSDPHLDDQLDELPSYPSTSRADRPPGVKRRTPRDRSNSASTAFRQCPQGSAVRLRLPSPSTHGDHLPGVVHPCPPRQPTHGRNTYFGRVRFPSFFGRSGPRHHLSCGFSLQVIGECPQYSSGYGAGYRSG